PASSSRPHVRSFRTTSASRSPTFASATSTRLSRGRCCGRTWPSSCGSSAMPGEAESRLRERLARLRSASLLGGAKISGELERLQRQLDQIQTEPSDEEIWRSVELARHPDRPYTLDYVERMLDDWVELHGDRGRADDGAMVTGIGRFDERTVALVGHQKGRNLKERLDR